MGDSYWIMEGSCRSGKDLAVTDLIRHHAGDKRTLKQNTLLAKGQVHLIKLDAELDLTGKRILGKCTGRSSIGRLDVLVRALLDKGTQFDLLPPDSQGELYLEVAPITFDLLASPGTRLSQLRLFRGREDLFTLSMEELSYEEPFPVVDSNGKEIREPCKEPGNERGNTFPFSLDLSDDPETGCCGFVAKKQAQDAINPDLQKHYDPRDFWEPVHLEKEALVLEMDRLYILRSFERLHLPGTLAVECQAYTETLGEWRVEYAGFAHPWFGWTRDEGTPIIFEVRGHNIPTILRHRLQLGKVSFRRMSAEAKLPEEEEQYEKQELKLSGCFKAWCC